MRNEYRRRLAALLAVRTEVEQRIALQVAVKKKMSWSVRFLTAICRDEDRRTCEMLRNSIDIELVRVKFHYRWHYTKSAIIKNPHEFPLYIEPYVRKYGLIAETKHSMIVDYFQ
ncbi:hypothetical protein R1R65_001587 [Klebsiella oxytoca]|nr:hypothetical protein [Klebsiella oxytoca]